MFTMNPAKAKRVLFAAVFFCLIAVGPDGMWSARADGPPGARGADGRDTRSKGAKSPKRKGVAKKPPAEDPTRIRWGQQPSESDAKYDARHGRYLKRVRRDKAGDYSGGRFVDRDGRELRLWTYPGQSFICRSDINAEFTVELVMYMEMLHRESAEVYAKLLQVPADKREPIEVIVFSKRDNYVANGGSEHSGGFFDPWTYLRNDRAKSWPARHYRLVMFTDEITDFAKWPKGALKHEAAHMELQLRLKFTRIGKPGVVIPVLCPIWWNEGQATIFEYWDFDKGVDANLAEVPNRGRYAPLIRRINGTEMWKSFDYLWNINPREWGEDMNSFQGALDYAQSWSLAAYMFTSGRDGRRDFRRIYDLSTSVGVLNKLVVNRAERCITDNAAWLEAFPLERRAQLEKHWLKWTSENVSQPKRVPDEEYFLKCFGCKPEVVGWLERYTREEWENEVKPWLQSEEQRRKDARTIEK